MYIMYMFYLKIIKAFGITSHAVKEEFSCSSLHMIIHKIKEDWISLPLKEPQAIWGNI